MEYRNLVAFKIIAENDAEYIKETTRLTIDKIDEDIEYELNNSFSYTQNSIKDLEEAIANGTEIQGLSGDELKPYLEDHKKNLANKIKYFQEMDAQAVRVAALISKENIEAINATGIFTIKLINYEKVQMSLVGTVSKAVFKTLVELSGQRRFNKNEFTVSLYQFEKLEEVIRKSTKLKQDTLETILKCRLEGLYKGKFKNGKTWNKGGIDKA